MTRRNSVLTLIATLVSFGLVAARADAGPIDWVYRDKIRLGWTPERWDQYKLMKDAGMNVVMPRLELDVPMDDAPHAFDKPLSEHDAQIMADLLKGSELSKSLGLKYFHSLDFAADSQTYEGGTRENPARYNDGNLPSPIDPVYFKRTILDRVERVLKLLADQNRYALDGVIIDPEMYALGGALHGDPDYGKFAFEQYQRESKTGAPSTVSDVSSRKQWLADQKLDQAYIEWQFARVKQFGTELRQLVHAYRPAAILGYIIYEDRMWFHATAAGLTSSEIPVFVGPESTYSGVMDQSMIDYFDQMRKQIGVKCLLVPGIDMGLVNKQVPAERLAVLTGNVYQRCQHTDGYFLYAIYNFGSTEAEQGPFFATIKTISDALDKTALSGTVDASLKAAPLPVILPAGFQEMLKAASALQPLPVNSVVPIKEFVAPMLRGALVLLSWPDADERQSFTVNVVKLGNYLDNGNMRTFSKAGALIQENPIPLNSRRVFWIPDVAGAPCPTAITAGSNRWTIEAFTGKVMLYTGDVIGVNAGNTSGGRFYFYVPPVRTEFGMLLLGDKGEPADYSLYDPDGKLVKSWKSLNANSKESIPVTRGGVWSINVDHLVDDGGFGLIDLPNYFALRPQDVMVSKPKEQP